MIIATPEKTTQTVIRPGRPYYSRDGLYSLSFRYGWRLYHRPDGRQLATDSRALELAEALQVNLTYCPPVKIWETEKDEPLVYQENSWEKAIQWLADPTILTDDETDAIRRLVEYYEEPGGYNAIIPAVEKRTLRNVPFIEL